MSPVSALIIRAAARLSAATRAEGRLIAAEWAGQVAARRGAPSRLWHAVMLLVGVGIPARVRRWVLGPRWGVVAAVLLVLGVGLTIGSYLARDRSEHVFERYGLQEQAAGLQYRAWEVQYGAALESGDPAARQDAWKHLMAVGPWRVSENLRNIADIALVASLAVLSSVLIAVSLALLGWRWRRRLGIRFGHR